MKWVVPRIWEGGTCVIIGGGPSMLKQFDIPVEIIQGVYSGELKPAAYSPYLDPIHNMHVIAVNVAYQIGDWIDVCFFGDNSTWDEEKEELAKWKGLRVTCAEELIDDIRLKHLERNGKKRMGISVEPNMVSWNSNSGSAAINLAVHFGVKKIILLGFDMKLDEGRNQHWHKIYKKQLKTKETTLNSTFRKHLNGFQQMKKDLDTLGVEVINCSPESSITVFPKMNFKDINVLDNPGNNINLIFEKEQEEIHYDWRNKNQIKKICITTTFDRNYKEAGKTLFNSIKRHTDCTGIDFKIITSDTEVVKDFGEENCYFITEEIKNRYSNVKYHKELTVEKYASSWYRFEIFNMTEYDRVICIDSDCICVEDISYLFSEELNQYDLISVEDHIVSKCFVNLVPELERNGSRLSNLTKRLKEGKIDIQPALLVANKSIVNKSWYEKLISFANIVPFSYSIDEGVLNDFIYQEGIKIKLLPLEWDFQDIYEKVCLDLLVPTKPIIIHCQESKPFKKSKAQLEPYFHKYHDLWWEENKFSVLSQSKTIVVIIVWNRFENLRRWINCWNQCDTSEAELVVVHNQETDNHRYWQLCSDNGIKYVYRENVGFDIGAFQDICKERLANFPNEWNNMIWVTDDCIPMAKDFVSQYLKQLTDTNTPCYEISKEVKTHVRTTGFLITKEIAKKLIFPKDPIHNREDCYQFEHKSKNALYEQLISMGKHPIMVNKDLKTSPLWDSDVRAYLNLMKKHEEVFAPLKSEKTEEQPISILDELAIKYKADKSSRYHNYASKYDKILTPYKDIFTSILEIGVAQGQSVRMWTDYFPKAKIHGADIDKASEICEAFSNRIKFHLLDQRDAAQLKNLEPYSPFDLIIDDGNHFWMEQILTFKILFPYVRKGGIYIIEDTTTSYWKEYRNHPISTIEYFKTLIDEINFKGEKATVPLNPPEEFGDWEKGWHCREDCHTTVPLFESIQFMNGFIVIYKR